MTEIRRYLNNVKARLATSAVIATVQVVAERSLDDRGYLRARLTLHNGDFLEVSEYFVVTSGQLATVDYRYQWMDPAHTRLIRRWDSARHFPGLPNFPHHVHLAEIDEPIVFPVHPRTRQRIDALSAANSKFEIPNSSPPSATWTCSCWSSTRA